MYEGKTPTMFEKIKNPLGRAKQKIQIGISKAVAAVSFQQN